VTSKGHACGKRREGELVYASLRTTHGMQVEHAGTRRDGKDKAQEKIYVRGIWSVVTPQKDNI